MKKIQAVFQGSKVISNSEFAFLMYEKNRFGEKELELFLNKINAKAFIRGHDYNLNGMIVYKKCLTIFSSRRYGRMGNGGILIAKINENINSMDDIEIENFCNGKWKKYEAIKFN